MKKTVALITVMGIAVSLLAGCAGKTQPEDEPEVKPSAAIASPVYPEMVEYPNEEKFFDGKTGVFDQDGFDKVYKAWSEDKNRQQDFKKKFTGDFKAYFSRTSREILLDENQLNQAYCPLSMYMALSMLAEVTDGDSRKEILGLLGNADINQTRTNANAIWNLNYSADGATNSTLANSLWLKTGLDYQKKTVDSLADSYCASVFQGKMGSKAYNDELHGWINKETGDLLKEQADGLNFDDQTVLGLVSTVFFQAKWADAFNSANNTKGVFHGAKADSEAEFMNMSGSGQYFWADNFGAVQKHLINGGSVWFVLPDEGVSVNDVIGNSKLYDLTFLYYHGDNWKNAKDLMINLSLPKFDVSADYDLSEHLKNLGINSAFDKDKADFSPLLKDGNIPVFLSEAKQGTRVAMDEEGVTAASFTAMILSNAAAPPDEKIDFVLDRPFIFVINGIAEYPLFIGVVNQLP